MERDKHKWETNSRDERQSEFAHSGYQTPPDGASDSTLARRRLQRKRRSPLFGLLWPLLAVLGVSALVLGAMVLYLHR